MVKCLTCQSTRILSIFKKIQNSFIITFKKFLSLFLSLSFLLLSFAFHTFHLLLNLSLSLFSSPLFRVLTFHLLLNLPLFSLFLTHRPQPIASKRRSIFWIQFSEDNNSFAASILSHLSSSSLFLQV